MPTDSDARRRFLWILFACACALVVVVIWPFAGAFFAASVLAAVLHPWHERLSARLGGRAHLSAGLVTLVGMVAVVLPLGLLGALVLREGQRAAAWVAETLEREGFEGLVEPLPDALEGPALRALQRLPRGLLGEASARAHDAAQATRAVQESPGEGLPPADEGADLGAAAGAAGAAGDVLAGLASFLVRLGVMLTALFFFLSEGRRLIDYVIDVVPLEEQRTRTMLREFREVAVGVLVSTVATAGAQTLTALVGYLIAGLPAIPLLLFVTFVLSFVPAVGGGSTVAAVGVFLCLSGRVGMGLFLIAWGFGVVGVVDNVVKPLLAKGRAHLPTSVVFFAMICGLAAFGPMGLVAGPLILALFKLVVGMLQEQGTQPRRTRDARGADRVG